jgi:hypothetical protein
MLLKPMWRRTPKLNKKARVISKNGRSNETAKHKQKSPAVGQHTLLSFGFK